MADIFRRHGPAYRKANTGHLSLGQLKVMSAIERCRTAALGGHVEICADCAHMRIAYNSCRNRHCPKCQAINAKDWLAAREADLLPVPYYHVVFTLPAPIAAIAYQNKGVRFKWKDYRIKTGNRAKVMQLPVGEFIRRFLIHMLPDGFKRIRHYGLLANGQRAENIARARQLLNSPLPCRPMAEKDDGAEDPVSPMPCPCCGGRMIIVDYFKAGCSPRLHPILAEPIDTS